MELFHFTCEHSAAQIVRAGQLVPNRHPLLGKALVWLTDHPRPDRFALGLTSTLITCDRTAVRVTVTEIDTVQRWSAWVLWHPVPTWVRETLETGAEPGHWYVATEPLPIAAMETNRGL